ncbi:hypothetical protein EUGRSUZ_A02673 [Eucalyptus grandis]|uniref:Uncharacterized protein n=2 Tax=Eucalyptus grandis TaxID=71139 RepID=A0ACC3M8B4_EUCGR|nr:hypothetical protein EUGRSUZ_A02673 [Eucalyptus grandis]
MFAQIFFNIPNDTEIEKEPIARFYWAYLKWSKGDTFLLAFISQKSSLKELVQRKKKNVSFLLLQKLKCSLSSPKRFSLSKSPGFSTESMRQQ